MLRLCATSLAATTRRSSLKRPQLARPGAVRRRPPAPHHPDAAAFPALAASSVEPVQQDIQVAHRPEHAGREPRRRSLNSRAAGSPLAARHQECEARRGGPLRGHRGHTRECRSHTIPSTQLAKTHALQPDRLAQHRATSESALRTTRARGAARPGRQVADQRQAGGKLIPAGCRLPPRRSPNACTRARPGPCRDRQRSWRGPSSATTYHHGGVCADRGTAAVGHHLRVAYGERASEI